jgi:hypothetical protein
VQASPASSPLHRSAQSSGQLAIARSNANQINPFERGNPYKFRHESNTALGVHLLTSFYEPACLPVLNEGQLPCYRRKRKVKPLTVLKAPILATNGAECPEENRAAKNRLSPGSTYSDANCSSVSLFLVVNNSGH